MKQDKHSSPEIAAAQRDRDGDLASTQLAPEPEPPRSGVRSKV